MLTKIQNMLRRLGAYDRMKESFAYDCYQRIRYGRPLRWRDDEVFFFRSLLGTPAKGLLIFDIGANRGQRTAVFLRLGARVVAVEPDPKNQRLLARRFASRGRPVTVVGKAASDSDAGATLWVHEPGAGINSLSRKWVESLGADEGRFGRRLEFPGQTQVETTTLDFLVGSFGVPDYIKIDVEGHEPSVLRGLGRSVPFLSFEVNLPEFLPEGLECVGILERLDASGRFNWFGGSRCRLGLPEWLPGTGFRSALRVCREASIEVVWTSSPAPRAPVAG